MPTIVFLGSLGSTLAMWDRQVDELASSASCVRLDWPGHGETPSRPGPYTLADLGHDVIDTLDTVGIECPHFVGLSLGGMVTMWLAEHASDRVDRIALLCTSAALGPSSQWTDRAAAVRHGGMDAVAATVVGRWFTDGYASTDPERIESFVAMVRSADPEGYAGCCEAIAAMDIDDRLTTVVAPTLVIAGRDDPATPPDHAERIADGIPAATMAVVDGAHLASWERADTVNDLLRGHFRLPTAGEGSSSATDVETGMAVRRQVLGDEYVDRAMERATDLARPFQDYITASAWGRVWSRDALDQVTRRRLTIALLTALRADHELHLHIGAALRAGMDPADIAEVILHTAVYAGAPAANAAMATLESVVASHVSNPIDDRRTDS